MNYNCYQVSNYLRDYLYLIKSVFARRLFTKNKIYKILWHIKWKLGFCQSLSKKKQRIRKFEVKSKEKAQKAKKTLNKVIRRIAHSKNIWSLSGISELIHIFSNLSLKHIFTERVSKLQVIKIESKVRLEVNDIIFYRYLLVNCS